MPDGSEHYTIVETTVTTGYKHNQPVLLSPMNLSPASLDILVAITSWTIFRLASRNEKDNSTFERGFPWTLKTVN